MSCATTAGLYFAMVKFLKEPALFPGPADPNHASRYQTSCFFGNALTTLLTCPSQRCLLPLSTLFSSTSAPYNTRYGTQLSQCLLDLPQLIACLVHSVAAVA